MRLLIKIWQRLTDPVFFQKRFRIFQRAIREPVEVDGVNSIQEVNDFRHAVVFVAHPDDESFCSGLICQLIDAGARVDVLCLTRGEGGPTGGLNREDLGKAREVEMRRACRVLGVTELIFLDHVDPVAKEFRLFAPDVSEADLAKQVRPFLKGADLIISHGSSGEYWHPAHLLVHAAVKRAIVRLPDCQWMTFLANQRKHDIPKLVNTDDPAHLTLDVSHLHGRRKAALDCHTSQLPLFGRFAEGTVDDFVEKTSIEAYCIKDPEND
ncbi:MAG: PIG-L family deacetylase [Verrucomicrobiales bacterium]|nr:PIG-L family deacetylase [Verrucomicrobiales bacterium]